MRVTVFNNKYEDSISFEFSGTEVTDEIRQYVLQEVHGRGWEDKDCWSEVHRK